MRKDTLLEIILGTIGGLIFAIGMCMCLIPEWNLLKVGIVVSIIGFIILLCIIPVYRSNNQKKTTKKITWQIVLTWIIGLIGALIMGYGMSKVMTDNPSQNNIVIGMITGIIGLIICILNYPIYTYIKENKK